MITRTFWQPNILAICYFCQMLKDGQDFDGFVKFDNLNLKKWHLLNFRWWIVLRHLPNDFEGQRYVWSRRQGMFFWQLQIFSVMCCRPDVLILEFDEFLQKLWILSKVSVSGLEWIEQFWLLNSCSISSLWILFTYEVVEKTWK